MSRRKRKNNSGFSLFVFQDIITCVMGIMLLVTMMMCLQITAAVVSPEQTPAEETIRQMQRQAAALSAEIASLQSTVDENASLLNSGAINDPALLRDRTVTLDNDNQLAEIDVKALWEQQTSGQETLDTLKKTAQRRSEQTRQTESLKQDNETLDEKVKKLTRGDRVVYNAHTSESATCWLVEMTTTTDFQVAELGQRSQPRVFSSRSDLTSWILQRHQTGTVFMLIVKPAAADVLEQLTTDLRAQNVSFGFDLLPQDKTAIDPVSGASI
jgi:cell division protein FtsB